MITIFPLTEKLNHYVEEKVIILTPLLNSFLINRKHCVRNEIFESDWTIINHGVLKGTALGPLVFILYVKHFGEEIGKGSNVLQFADDAAILCNEKNEHCLVAKAKKHRWKVKHMEQNKLTLNEKKIEIMVFKNEESPTVNCIDFKSHSLKPTDKCRHLSSFS